MHHILEMPDHNVHLSDDMGGLPDAFPDKEYDKYIILVDTNTREQCLPLLLQQMPGLKDALVLCIEPGEEFKLMETCEQLWKQLLDAEVSRHALWINLGGGVICDMGGLAASLYKRGIHFVNLPTTLLSQVDATLGGKLAVDFDGQKNMIGLFRNPKMVWINTGFLNTLPREELISGFAEMLKHSLIADREQLRQLMQVGPDEIMHHPDLIAWSLEIKKTIVLEDFEEHGFRKALNFGHTAGHAIESLSLNQGRPMLHGHAVAWGLMAELWLSAELMGFPQKMMEHVNNYLLATYGDTLTVALSIDNLVRLAANDKKNLSGRINCSLLADVGQPVIDQEIEPEQLMAAFEYLTTLR